MVIDRLQERLEDEWKIGRPVSLNPLDSPNVTIYPGLEENLWNRPFPGPFNPGPIDSNDSNDSWRRGTKETNDMFKNRPVATWIQQSPQVPYAKKKSVDKPDIAAQQVVQGDIQAVEDKKTLWSNPYVRHATYIGGGYIAYRILSKSK